MRLRQNLRHRDGRRGCRKADRLACAQDGGLDPDPQAPRMGHGVAGYFLKEEGNGSGAGKQVVSVGPRSAGGPRDRPAQLPAKAICLNASYPEPSLPSGIRCMPPPADKAFRPWRRRAVLGILRDQVGHAAHGAAHGLLHGGRDAFGRKCWRVWREPSAGQKRASGDRGWHCAALQGGSPVACSVSRSW